MPAPFNLQRHLLHAMPCGLSRTRRAAAPECRVAHRACRVLGQRARVPSRGCRAGLPKRGRSCWRVRVIVRMGQLSASDGEPFSDGTRQRPWVRGGDSQRMLPKERGFCRAGQNWPSLEARALQPDTDRAIRGSAASRVLPHVPRAGAVVASHIEGFAGSTEDLCLEVFHDADQHWRRRNRSAVVAARLRAALC